METGGESQGGYLFLGEGKEGGGGGGNEYTK